MAKIIDWMGKVGNIHWWMKKEIPQIILDIGFDFIVDNKKVWGLVKEEEIPITLIPIGDLVWIFDYPFLWNGGEIFNLKPIDVINNPKKYENEYTRVIDTEMKYPIDIMKSKKKQGSRWLTLDGLHRLMKSYILNKEAHGGTYCKDMVVMTRIVPRNNIPFIKREGK